MIDIKISATTAWNEAIEACIKILKEQYEECGLIKNPTAAGDIYQDLRDLTVIQDKTEDKNER